MSSVDVTVNVDTTTPYNEGYAAGETAQKAKLTSLNATANGTYHREDGYNAVTVNVPLTDGEYIVSSLGTKTITASEGGFSEVAIVTRAGLTNDIKGIKQRPFYTAAEIADLESSGVNFYDMFNEQDSV